MRYDIKEYQRSGDDDSLIDKYPLLYNMTVRYNYLTEELKSELIIYINAAYAAKKGK